MKIIHTIPDMDIRSGGTASCAFNLMEALYARESEARLLTVASPDREARILGRGHPWLESVPFDCRFPTNRSKGFRASLEASTPDILHTHGLWQDVNHATCAMARRRGIPCVISPHGMLYPWSLKQSRWKKQLAMLLWQRRDIMEASAILVSCDEEMHHLRNLGYRGPVALLPHPVAIPQGLELLAEKRDKAVASLPDDGIRTVGFMGRITPIKNIEAILKGMALLPHDKRSRLRLQISGRGEPGYEASLRSLSSRLGIDRQVCFAGFADGEEKYNRLLSLSALLLPSWMENFGMVAAEALLCHTPVMTSTCTPWEELPRIDAGWWREPTPEAVAQTLTEILDLSPRQLRTMGRNGADHIRNTCSPLLLSRNLLDLYNWLLNPDSLTPNFIHTT